jgi:hypothetical protein
MRVEVASAWLEAHGLVEPANDVVFLPHTTERFGGRRGEASERSWAIIAQLEAIQTLPICMDFGWRG